MDSVKRILDSILKQNPELRTRLRESVAVSGWEAAVGPQIAKHSRIFKVENGILFIEVDHPAWRTELHHRKLQILEKMNAIESGSGPAIQDLFFIEPRQERKSEARTGSKSGPRLGSKGSQQRGHGAKHSGAQSATPKAPGPKKR